MNETQEPTSKTTHEKPTKLLDLKSGGWVLIGAAILCLAYFSVFVFNAVNRQEQRIGDGNTLESYQFNLINNIIPLDKIIPANMPKDGLEALTNPEMFTPDQVENFNLEERGKYLVSHDPVIGIEINGEARAYPLRVLNWHEVINDTLGGTPIAVTFNPLSHSIVAFNRTIEGETLDFGFSGLLYNSHHLIYDRREDSNKESLWCPLMRKGVAGPLSQTRLPTIACTLTHWADWVEEYPDTTTIKPTLEYKKRYQRSPYAKYSEDPDLQFEVSPQPPTDDRPLKSEMVILETARETHTFFYDEILEKVNKAGNWQTEINGNSIQFEALNDPTTIKVLQRDDKELPVYYSYWFAWYSINMAGN